MQIAHLSDLHCPADSPRQADALVGAVRDAKPDLVVVSGDLTRAGRRREFAAARELLARFESTLLVVPGNHDVPVFNAVQRVSRPFARFDAAFAPGNVVVNFPGVQVIGLNTATGMQASLDWSLGWALPHRIARVIAALKAAPADTFQIVTCHHPLLPEAADLRRSHTKGGPEAFRNLAHAGMNMLLHGHLHRQKARIVNCDGRHVTIAGASTALGDRERGEPSGFNLIAVNGSSAPVTAMRWDGSTFQREPLVASAA
ncbi:MAG TPA: metallophosphoesterase [Rhizomicrobium sp.]|jgi:3',5'-cyclic AMP phosphodiesterase CpdA|nr:metallophosphoesterase [Rhizomicrobium sp.]